MRQTEDRSELLDELVALLVSGTLSNIGHLVRIDFDDMSQAVQLFRLLESLPESQSHANQ